MDPDAHLLVMTVVQYWLIWDLANSCLCLEIIPGREVWCHALAGFWWPLKGQNMSLFIQVHRSRGHLHDLSSPQVSRTSLIKQVHNSEGHLSSNRSITQKDISHQTGPQVSRTSLTKQVHNSEGHLSSNSLTHQYDHYLHIRRAPLEQTVIFSFPDTVYNKKRTSSHTAHNLKHK